MCEPVQDDCRSSRGDSGSSQTSQNNLVTAHRALPAPEPANCLPTCPHQSGQPWHECRPLLVRVPLERNVDKVDGVPSHERLQVRRDGVREGCGGGVEGRDEGEDEQQQDARQAAQREAGYDDRACRVSEGLISPARWQGHAEERRENFELAASVKVQSMREAEMALQYVQRCEQSLPMQKCLLNPKRLSLPPLLPHGAANAGADADKRLNLRRKASAQASV